MNAALNAAVEFVEDHFDSEITFVGHSKGGAEAAANAIMTNRDCIIFNPAAVNLGAYGLSAGGYTAHMSIFVVEGEILHAVYTEILGLTPGSFVYLETQHEAPWYTYPGGEIYTSIKNHMMEAVIAALKEAGYSVLGPTD